MNALDVPAPLRNLLARASVLAALTVAGDAAAQAPEWYATPEALRVGARVTAFQQTSGAWPMYFHPGDLVEAPDRKPAPADRTDGWMLGTARTLRFLVRVREASGSDRLDPSILRGIDFLLAAQYPNGGWPKIHPADDVVERAVSTRNPRGRYPLITFNDDTQAEVIDLVVDVARGEAGLGFADPGRRVRARAAVERGTRMILRLQLSDARGLAGWAQQYDERTLEPLWGRRFEPLAVTGHETANVLRFLMRLEDPDPEVRRAVRGGVEWLQRVKIEGVRVEEDPRAVTVTTWDGRAIPDRHDRWIVEDPSAPPIWARFYEIGTNRPLFASADDTARYALEGISVERRSGYAWYGEWPAGLWEEYGAWLRRQAPDGPRPGYMSREQALANLRGHTVPAFWPTRVEQVEARVSTLRRGMARVIATSPGGRAVHLVTYGEKEPGSSRANFNSAAGGRDLAAYRDRSLRTKPVLLLVGPVHGQEAEGLAGLMNLIEVMETGRDLLGRDQSALRALGERTRLLNVPTGNPDGVARFRPGHLVGLTRADKEYWGQGTWADDSLVGHPFSKLRHPMVGPDVGNLGSYFNDAGVNPMHEELTRPFSAEAPAILDVARAEAPDLAVSLHSRIPAPAILRPSYVPLEVQEEVRSLARRYNALLEARGIPTSPLPQVGPEEGDPPPYFNLVSALYHVGGATPFTHENTHGVTEAPLGLVEILDAELLLFEAMLRHALGET